uniref:DDE Tnp4 domain-containing protein n=1 Tax=Meloidogyne hapla TaxID=6305 RepID=A0A1I8B234_MELHA
MAPYFFVGDGAFPLSTGMMKPFSGTKDTAKTDRDCRHNCRFYFSSHPSKMADSGIYCEENGLWRQDVQHQLKSVDQSRGGHRRYNPSAIGVRDDLMTFVSTVGSVPWQDDLI